MCGGSGGSRKLFAEDYCVEVGKSSDIDFSLSAVYISIVVGGLFNYVFLAAC